MNISTLISRSAKHWERPTFDQPMPINAASLTELGTDWRGRQWYRSKYGEVVVERLIDEARQVLPNALILEWVDAKARRTDKERPPRYWQVLSVHAPGTFETMRSPAVRRQKPAPPMRPVSALAGLHLAATMTPGLATVGGPPRPAIDGPEAIIAKAARQGANVRLDIDRTGLVTESPGGRPAPGVIELVSRNKRLLIAHLRGEAKKCTVRKHEGEPPVAVEEVVGGAFACRPCMDGVA